MTLKVSIAAALSMILLAACGDDDVILPGERFDIREQPELVNRALPVSLPVAQTNADWGHRNGSPQHNIAHPALGTNLSPVFVTDIGSGDGSGARITSHPVVAGGVIYTIDARALVTATSVDGSLLWSRDLTPNRHKYKPPCPQRAPPERIRLQKSCQTDPRCL